MIARFVPVVRSSPPLWPARREGLQEFQAFNVRGPRSGWCRWFTAANLFGNVPDHQDNLGIILIVGSRRCSGRWSLPPCSGAEPTNGSPADQRRKAVEAFGCRGA